MNHPITIQSALAHHQAGRLAEAERHYRRLIAQNPNHADALHLLGMLASQAGKPQAAFDLISRAAAVNPKNFQYHYGLGNVLLQLNRPGDATASLETAVKLKPDLLDAICTLGSTYLGLEQIDRAVECYRSALRLNDKLTAVHNDLAVALQRTGKLSEAIASFDRACALEPKIPEIRWGLARALLINGEFHRGWKEFECRLDVSVLNLARTFPQPRWIGEDLRGKTILLYAEGGFGDALHFVRYAPMVASRGATVLLECQPELVSLLSSAKGISRIIPRGAALPPFDFQSPLQSLPLVFDTTLQTIPLEIPYLSPPENLIQYWNYRLARDGSFKVGLSWAGSANNDDLRTRSLAEFSPLADVPGVTFYSLQKGPDASQPIPRGMNLKSPADPSGDFADTAALVVNLDLVISVDTSVVHLAGALGVPTWVVIPKRCDFRWMFDRTDSPWYPSLRLFRQSRHGHWPEPFQNIARELRQLVQTKHP